MTEQGFVAPDAKVEKGALAERCTVYRGAVVGQGSVLGPCSSIGDDSTVLRSRLGAFVSINRRNCLHDSKIGDLTYTGQFTAIHSANVGKYCSIAFGVDIGAASHDMTCTSTLPMAHFDFARTGRLDKTAHADLSTRCFVGNDVWIGAHAIILGDVKVGDGAVVGAGAVVTKNVPPYAIVAGVPARIIKYRFSQDIIRRLMQISWWNWPLDDVTGHSDLLTKKIDEDVLLKMEEIASGLQVRSASENFATE